MKDSAAPSQNQKFQPNVNTLKLPKLVRNPMYPGTEQSKEFKETQKGTNETSINHSPRDSYECDLASSSASSMKTFRRPSLDVNIPQSRRSSISQHSYDVNKRKSSLTCIDEFQRLLKERARMIDGLMDEDEPVADIDENENICNRQKMPTLNVVIEIPEAEEEINDDVPELSRSKGWGKVAEMISAKLQNEINDIGSNVMSEEDLRVLSDRRKSFSLSDIAYKVAESQRCAKTWKKFITKNSQDEKDPMKSNGKATDETSNIVSHCDNVEKKLRRPLREILGRDVNLQRRATMPVAYPRLMPFESTLKPKYNLNNSFPKRSSLYFHTRFDMDQVGDRGKKSEVQVPDDREVGFGDGIVGTPRMPCNTVNRLVARSNKKSEEFAKYLEMTRKHCTRVRSLEAEAIIKSIVDSTHLKI